MDGSLHNLLAMWNMHRGKREKCYAHTDKQKEMTSLKMRLPKKAAKIYE